MEINVNPCQVSPRNFCIGDVLLERETSQQFAIVDFVEGMVCLRKLNWDERTKPQFLDGTVVFFDETEFKDPGDAEPSPATIAHQIEGGYEPGDPEDPWSPNYVPGLS